MKERSSFTSRIGFVLAAAGSAVGLGNMWRFPYLAAKYGGGAFLITYVLLAVTFGFTLMITEVAMGRRTRMSCIEAFGSLNRRFAPLGWLAALIPVIIAPYYCVIGGWVVKYFVEFVRGNGMAVSSDTYFGDFISMAGSGILENPLLWFVIFVPSAGPPAARPAAPPPQCSWAAGPGAARPAEPDWRPEAVR